MHPSTVIQDDKAGTGSSRPVREDQDPHWRGFRRTFGAANIRASSSPLFRRNLEAQFYAFKDVGNIWNEHS